LQHFLANSSPLFFLDVVSSPLNKIPTVHVLVFCYAHILILCTLVQASEDAKNIIQKERQEAQAEVEAARATALRCQQALEEQAHSLSQAEQEVENMSWVPSPVLPPHQALAMIYM
jgi:hypothetical protein